ncbi:MAG: hypothetical protein ACK4N5_05975, partial [Myxococcales bacterium]
PFSATVTPHAGTGHRPALYLLSRCPRQTSGDEVACATASSSGGSATVSVGSLPAGTHFLVVDGVSGGGAFDLTASRATGGTPGSGDNCSGPIALTLTNNTATVSGSTIGRVNDTSSSNTNCGGGSGADVVYTFNNPVQGAVQINLKNKTPGWTPSMYLRSSCATTTDIGCNYARSVGGDVLLLLENVAAGPLFLWIDGKDASAGEFDLTVRVNVPTYGTGGDTCASAVPVTILGNIAVGRGTVSPSNTDARSSTCSSGAKDVVYRFLVPSGVRRLRAYVDTTNFFVAPSVHLTRGAICSTASSVQCAAGQFFAQNWAEVAIDNPVADTWYLWVEATGTTELGAYNFEIWAE